MVRPLVFVPDLGVPSIASEDLHHLIRVRRYRPGSVVWAGDGSGVARAGVLEANGSVAFGGDYITQERPARRVGVALFLPKGDRLSFALAKLTEVGVDDIYPLVGVTDRRGGKEPSFASVGRMQRIVREAASQSERLWLPKLHAICDVKDFVGEHAAEIAVCDKGGGRILIEKSIWMVGPESGQIPGVGGLPEITLGETILRTETAAVVAATLLVAIRAGFVTPGA